MKFLLFQHVPHEPPGLIASSIKKLGHELEIIEFWKDNPKIPDINAYQGLIIMGGPMGVYEGPDKFPSKEVEVKAIRGFLNQKKPIIGFCLGIQLLSYVLGGKVYPNIKNGKRLKEIGFYTVDLNEEGEKDLLLKGFPNPMEVFQFHGDACDIPVNGIKLASSPLCDNQAFRFGKNAYGFLFHVEVKPELIKEMLRIEKKWIHEDFDMNEAKILKEAEEKKNLMQKQCERLFENFTSLAQKMHIDSV